MKNTKKVMGLLFRQHQSQILNRYRVPFLKRTRALSCIQEFVFREVYSYFFGILYLACILRQ